VPDDEGGTERSSRSIIAGAVALAATLVLAAVVFKSPFHRNDASAAHVTVRAAPEQSGPAGRVLPEDRSQEAVVLGAPDHRRWPPPRWPISALRIRP
jgi:hypothetical protein